VKHHYVPQFLLRRWTNAAGKLRIFMIRNRRFVCKERAPEYTGFEYDLYSVITNAFGLSKHVLEENFFKPIDSSAAKVLQKIERHEVITADEHISWTFFLSSLRTRQPDTLEFLRTDGMKLLTKFLRERDTATLAADAPSTEEWFERHLPGALEATTLANWLPRMVLHDDVTRAFSELKWWFREFTPDQPKLLLSDLPIHWEGGFNNAEFFIQLPIAPDRIFFGTRSEQTESFLSHLPGGDLIERANRTTLASSSQRIWASTDGDAKAFIEANLDLIGTNVVTFTSLSSKLL